MKQSRLTVRDHYRTTRIETEIKSMVAKCKRKNSFLMVGTIRPIQMFVISYPTLVVFLFAVVTIIIALFARWRCFDERNMGCVVVVSHMNQASKTVGGVSNK